MCYGSCERNATEYAAWTGQPPMLQLTLSQPRTAPARIDLDEVFPRSGRTGTWRLRLGRRTQRARDLAVLDAALRDAAVEVVAAPFRRSH